VEDPLNIAHEVAVKRSPAAAERFPKQMPRGRMLMSNKLLLLVFVLLQPGAFEAADRPSGPTIYISHVTVIDTETGAEAHDRTVVISGERIADVRESRDIKVPSGAKSLDGTAKFLIPGMWDMHVHLASQKSYKWAKSILLPLLVANGVTGVRDMGGDFQLIAALRKEIRSGALLGPEIRAAGPLVIGPPDRASPRALLVSRNEDGRQAVFTLKRTGVDFIKVVSTVPRGAYLSLAIEARKQHITFAGHVPESVTAIEASDAGQKSIEHFTGVWLNCSSRESELRTAVLRGMEDSEPFVLERVMNHLPPRGAIESYEEARCIQLFERLSKNRTWQVPTLVSEQAFSILAALRNLNNPKVKYIPGELQLSGGAINYEKLELRDVQDLAEYYDKSLALVRKMRNFGIKFMAGTDLPDPPQAGFSLHDELSLLVKGGLTPLEALQAATLNPARFFDRTGSMGTVKKGNVSDLILLSASPLLDINNTRKIEAVILKGRLIDRKLLDEVLARVEYASGQ
jgi:imidazolonepropionase-like amidohydrolase